MSRKQSTSSVNKDHDETIKRMTRAVRRADQAFGKVGGGTRSWVSECLMPALDEEGITLTIEATDASDMQ